MAAKSPKRKTSPKGDIISLKRVSFMVNPQYGGSTKSVDDPAGTIIARQDKAPLSVANAPKHELETILRRVDGTGDEHIKYEDGRIIYTIYGTDDEWFVKIKEYMFENQLLDVCIRPLDITEMLLIQGFPAEYTLLGTKTNQKKFIGNSVEVKVGMALFKAIDKEIQKNYI